MIVSDICYGLQNERDSKGVYIRNYDLEKGKEIVGRLTAEGGPDDAEFNLQINGKQTLTWKVCVQPIREESCCQIYCPTLTWDFLLRIPRKKEGVIIEFGSGDSKLVLLKDKTSIGWGPGSLRLVTSDAVDHQWSIAFDTGIVAFIEAVFRILALGLIPMKNENWILGSKVAEQLSQTDQQKLLILNATIRMWMLPNDFSHGS